MYPLNWKEIADRIKDLAGWCCENCKRPHCPKEMYSLSVHHIDGNPMNCDYTNLFALCQRCHLHWQAKYKAGQLPLLNLFDWINKRSFGFYSNIEDYPDIPAPVFIDFPLYSICASCEGCSFLDCQFFSLSGF
jgi:hypothetical protein